MAANNRRRLAVALALGAAGAMFAAPAAAQFPEFFRLPWGGGGYPAYPPPQNSPFYPRQQVYEPTKPPPPRKVETPPAETILVIGDAFADWLGYGLEETFADTPEVGVVRKIKATSGLARYEGKSDGPDWSQAVKDTLATEKPSAIVVMLGINDRLPLHERAPEKDKDKKAATTAPGQAAAGAESSSETAQPNAEPPGSILAAEKDRRSPTGNYEFHSDKWGELYEKRIDDMIAALKTKGVPVLWVGVPAVRGAKSTSDMSYLDELFRARAEKAGITYVDTWDGFVDDKGQFAVQGPDFEGQIRRLRTSDGVNFTKAGAEKLARYVEQDLRHVLKNRVIPVALPGPEEQSPPKGNVRPAIGPVVPLNVTSGEGGDLLGASGHPAQHESDPVATRVLSRGEAIAAPHGRADDFAWPRPDANGAAELTPAPLVPAVATPPKGAVGKSDTRNDAGKNDANKADAKKTIEKTIEKTSEVKSDKNAAPVPPANPANAAPNAAPRKPRPAGAALDGPPPRPPLPVGPSHN